MEEYERNTRMKKKNNATPAVRRPMKTIKADDVISSFRFPFVTVQSVEAKDGSRTCRLCLDRGYAHFDDLQYPFVNTQRLFYFSLLFYAAIALTYAGFRLMHNYAEVTRRMNTA